MKTTIIILVVWLCATSSYASPLQQSPETINNSYSIPGIPRYGNPLIRLESMHRHPETDVFPGYVNDFIKAWLSSGQAVYSEIFMDQIIKKR